MTQHQLASSKTWKPTANIRVFIVSLILIFIFGIITFYFDISTLFQTSSSLTNPQIFPKEYEFSKSDPFRLITGSNYLKCDSLSALEKDVRYDLDHRIYVEQEYQQLHSQNNLFCGTARLSKKSLKYFFKHTLSGVP